ncbi:sigma 54-interacting transcriptional regulator [Phaeovulum vinaykumarii]|uniref:Nif-specific regulatory protein n=1 Tax=Phaeovulum vinaykumarii TaxID=407234 RepID=A0A1N7LL74_9RHOB|nr:sigma 54-interacting transcriptional regulator [Phaeovulum vinaykumarii]SIS74583.1 Nif-specific regulatory protein [Phaeovulum vinaykumarii]SOC05122.1 Nif-specific regulatory protein [Phaeovulum vinaykumarii]
MTEQPEAESAAPHDECFPMDALCEAARILTGASDPIAAMPSVLNVLSSFMGLQLGAMALLQESAQGMGGAAQVNPYVIAATTAGSTPRPAGCGAIPPKVARLVLRTGVALVSRNLVDEFGEDALPPGAPHDRFALLAVPIRDQAHSPFVLGVLCALRDIRGHGAEHLDSDLRVMNMIASILEQSIRFRRLVARDRDRLMQEARDAIRAAAEAAEAATRAEGARALAQPISGIIGQSQAIHQVIGQIRKVAATQTPVLLRGESGTGKELFARAVHSLSDRRDKPFIKVNCAALSPTLLESELFGHEKGAFTGAVSQRKGRFEMADKGTLFLDEIGEIGPEFQAKLLRILQEGEFERVGGHQTLRVDVRLVTATNRNLEEAVAQGAFRADLYFRICVVPIVLPPLRERKEDIPVLAQAFLSRFNEKNDMAKELSPEALSTLAACNFPGNVRELENCIARVAALSPGQVIGSDDLACHQDHCLSADLWRLQTADRFPVGGLASNHQIPLPVLARRPPPGAPAYGDVYAASRAPAPHEPPGGYAGAQGYAGAPGYAGGDARAPMSPQHGAVQHPGGQHGGAQHPGAQPLRLHSHAGQHGVPPQAPGYPPAGGGAAQAGYPAACAGGGYPQGYGAPGGAAVPPAGYGQPPQPGYPAPPNAPQNVPPPAQDGPADEEDERTRLIDAMQRAGWVQAKAARLLGLTPRQIGYALKKHNIRIEKF